MFIHLSTGAVIETKNIKFNDEGELLVENPNSTTQPQVCINPYYIDCISDLATK